MSDGPAAEPIKLEVRDGVVLRGERWTGGARTVVLLHGGGQNRWSWRDTAGALGRAGFTAIALDARGHGESDWAPAGRYAIDDFVLDLVDVLGQLPQPSAVVGASLGGISGLLASARLARPLAALVLVDVVARNSPAGVARIAAFMRDTVGGFATLDDAARAIADYLPQRARRRTTEGLTRTLRPAPDGRWVWRWDPAMLDAGFGDQATELTPRLAEAAARLAAPCLLVRGSASDVVSDDAARELAAVIAGSEHAVVDGAGHTVAGDRNDAFTSAVVDFLVRRSRWDVAP